MLASETKNVQLSKRTRSVGEGAKRLLVADLWVGEISCGPGL